jgi:hypothetical protein
LFCLVSQAFVAIRRIPATLFAALAVHQVMGHRKQLHIGRKKRIACAATAIAALVVFAAAPRSAAAQTASTSTPHAAEATAATPDATADISITGKGDHTGTGGGTGGVNSSTLDVPRPRNALGVPSGAKIQVKLKKPIDSGHAKNGDMLDAVLVAPLGKIAAGSPVKLTVVAAAAAGQMRDVGELSLQVISVNGQDLLSNVITAEGEEGKRILADDAPTRGTDAILTPDKTITLPAA